VHPCHATHKSKPSIHAGYGRFRGSGRRHHLLASRIRIMPKPAIFSGSAGFLLSGFRIIKRLQPNVALGQPKRKPRRCLRCLLLTPSIPACSSMIRYAIYNSSPRPIALSCCCDLNAPNTCGRSFASTPRPKLAISISTHALVRKMPMPITTPAGANLTALHSKFQLCSPALRSVQL